MKEITRYAIVGAITAVIIYFLAPNIIGNRIEVVESTPHSDINYNKSNSYADVFKKVNKSVVSIYTRKSAARENIYFIDPREKALVKKKYSLHPFVLLNYKVQINLCLISFFSNL